MSSLPRANVQLPVDVGQAAISEGRLFWGSGYSLFGTPNKKLYSFGLPG